MQAQDRTLTSLADVLADRLCGHARPTVREWWENYVKESAPFLGVRMADIRAVTHGWYRDHVAEFLDPVGQLDLALSLFFRKHSEEKLAGTLFIQEILMPGGYVNGTRHVDCFAGLFANGGIYDWNVCDWFCVKVLGPLIKMHGRSCARRIAAWRSADDVWQARASLIAFVGLSDDAAFYPLVAKGCRTVARREERFAKTAVGWVLREISRHDVGWVRDHVEELLPLLSIESLRNATKYFDAADRKAYVRKLKSAG